MSTPWSQPPSDDDQNASSAPDPYRIPDSSDAPYSASSPSGPGAAGGSTPPGGYGSAPGNPYGSSSASGAPQGGYGQGAPGQPMGQPGMGQPGAGQPGVGYGQQPYQGGPGQQGMPGQPGTSRMVAGLLGIFLGGWGVHRFVLGYPGIGIAQILVTLVTCGLGSIWGLIEGIMILVKSPAFERDAQGRPLTD